MVADTDSFGKARIAVHCVLKYQHWPMIRKLIVYQKSFQWPMCQYSSDKTNAKQLEIATKSMFLATEGPTDAPLVMLGYSVGVFVQ
jgi:hypothetical protein